LGRPRPPPRSVIAILSYATAAFLLFTFFLTTQATIEPQRDDVAPLATATPTNTPSPVFSVTMAVLPSQRQVEISDTLVVTVSISVSEGCHFPIYELTLEQCSNEGPTFAYLSPPTHTVGPGVANPFSYTLTAVSTGTVVFGGRAYGERYCGDFWDWTYVSGVSEFVRVGEWPYRMYFPVICQD
jgi:hypothetical protein